MCWRFTRRARRQRCAITTGWSYVPTDKKVLFGHHFAAIAGAGRSLGRNWWRNGLPAGDDWLLAGWSRWCGAGFHGAVCFYAP
ncbi:carbon starvation CstA family protein [Escherichia coli]